jgi:proteasome lid subunit RPN8/RPN11
MIRWTEKAPDFTIQPLDRLFARLGFTEAVILWKQVGDGLLIVVDTHVRQRIENHLQSQRIEQGGLLIGRVFGEDPHDPVIVTVEEAVGASDAHGTGVSLIMGSRVWDEAQALCKEGLYIVGWYHSHPDLGAFFSGTGRNTQRAFFGNAHSIGLVSDPIRGQEKWFAGPDSVEVPSHARYSWPLSVPVSHLGQSLS